ncbi:hypothetical protein OUZ56_026437 [Daphnia magna]|uniref:Uncharacterized protein n=1 Tax=Daphnia magna TaxID=35525 RepID=A0ABQ9ZMR4_9CRUS|nr:hypothetical protein OUZ56_026437 [Daphnia magna]
MTEELYEPDSFTDAMQSADASQWETAIKDESSREHADQALDTKRGWWQKDSHNVPELTTGKRSRLW